MLFAASAQTARGTDLRSPESANLAGLVRTAEGQVNTLNTQLTALQSSVTGLTDAAGEQNSAVAQAQAGAAPLLTPAGLTAVTGPGIRVVLDDAHDRSGPTRGREMSTRISSSCTSPIYRQ